MRLRVVVLWNIGEREAMFPLVCHILEGNGLAVRGRPGMMVKRSVRKLLNSCHISSFTLHDFHMSAWAQPVLDTKAVGVLQD